MSVRQIALGLLGTETGWEFLSLKEFISKGWYRQNTASHSTVIKPIFWTEVLGEHRRKHRHILFWASVESGTEKQLSFKGTWATKEKSWERNQHEPRCGRARTVFGVVGAVLHGLREAFAAGRLRRQRGGRRNVLGWHAPVWGSGCCPGDVVCRAGAEICVAMNPKCTHWVDREIDLSNSCWTHQRNFSQPD